ncbi:hypothetical protein PIB30_048597 [Stylosanthes scabra]|uniref:Uncharacterized protein n=1 Tax=Stylosanthes scabra TaxID=79078 RepID=A0ABU6ZFW3_9FABA|nr:hypothetical protein [Stylosanthes scabra]
MNRFGTGRSYQNGPGRFLNPKENGRFGPEIKKRGIISLPKLPQEEPWPLHSTVPSSLSHYPHRRRRSSRRVSCRFIVATVSPSFPSSRRVFLPPSDQLFSPLQSPSPFCCSAWRSLPCHSPAVVSHSDLSARPRLSKGMSALSSSNSNRVKYGDAKL